MSFNCLVRECKNWQGGQRKKHMRQATLAQREISPPNLYNVASKTFTKHASFCDSNLMKVGSVFVSAKCEELKASIPNIPNVCQHSVFHNNDKTAKKGAFCLLSSMTL